MCPGRGAAFFTPLRRAGTYGYGSILDPGSAAHRHSASKTRVTALMALRSVRGTPNLYPEERSAAQLRRWLVRVSKDDAPHWRTLQVLVFLTAFLAGRASAAFRIDRA
jgi:hypothetical protein